MKKLLSVLLLSACSATAATYTSDGTLADTQAKINSAAAGDIIQIPSGTFTWGASGAHLAVNKAVTVQGAGTGSTTIIMSSTGVISSDGVIVITAAATVKDFSITGTANGSIAVTPFATSSVTGFRVTNIVYVGPSVTGYFAYCAASAGLFDHLTLTSNHGSSQLFQIRGSAAWWNSAHTMGTASTVFIEDCTFIGNATAAVTTGGAGKACVRFCTIGSMPMDAHMIETETTAEGTAHGSRQFEAYNNTWPTHDWVNTFWITGGTGMFFDNTIATGTGMWASFFEYGAMSGLTVPGGGYVPTPAHLPIPDQIGTGAYPQSAGQEPLFFFNNKQADGSNKPFIGASIASSATTAYGSTFYMLSTDGTPAMLTAGQDYVVGTVGGTFPSTTKIGRGTKAQMLASSPTAAGQGWWVTDEGSWRSGYTNTSGQLYTWNGSAWVLKYTPYTYPHPLQGGGGGGGSGGNSTATVRRLPRLLSSP